MGSFNTTPQEKMREDNRAKAQTSPMIWHLIVGKDKGITTLLPWPKRSPRRTAIHHHIFHSSQDGMKWLEN
jgi:hypothetical protein